MAVIKAPKAEVPSDELSDEERAFLEIVCEISLQVAGQEREPAAMIAKDKRSQEGDRCVQ